MPHHSKRSIEQYYAEYPEHERLRSARGQLEFERTKRIVQRFLPSSPAIVADVGGGTGPYSFWLAFFHRRAEIRTEMEDAGFEVVAQLPIEGLRILARDFDSLWNDPRKRSTLLELLARTEGIEEVNGASAHHLSVGMKG